MQRRQSAGSMSSIAAVGPGDAGIVDQHVEPAELHAHVGEQTVHIGLVGDVGPRRVHAFQRRLDLGQPGLVDVAEMDARARVQQRLDDRAADPGGTRGHQHPLPACGLPGHLQPPRRPSCGAALPVISSPAPAIHLAWNRRAGGRP